jgi:hypothetical protein
MKRDKPAKRRDRRTGLSPYQRHGKREYRYSASYYAWKARFVRKAARENADGRAAAA